jgi:putative chitinase
VPFPIKLAHLIACGATPGDADRFISPLNLAMIEFNITTIERPAMFIAQVAHESGAFRYTSELWGPTPQQLKYDDGGPLAQRLGNPPGTGYQWRGHGLIQVTGRYNHMATAKAFGIPEEAIILWLQAPIGAARSAAHYWATHGCNELADAFDFVAVTRAINGGLTGLQQRTELYRRITEAMTA